MSTVPGLLPPPPQNKQDQAEIAEFKLHYRKLAALVAIIWVSVTFFNSYTTLL